MEETIQSPEETTPTEVESTPAEDTDPAEETEVMGPVSYRTSQGAPVRDSYLVQ